MRNGGYGEQHGPVALELVAAAAAAVVIIAVAAAFGWQLGKKAGLREATAEPASAEREGQAGNENRKSPDVREEASGEGQAVSRSLLFIGNSHGEHLPGALEALARAVGIAVRSEQLTPDGALLYQHAAQAETLAAIESRQWDFVVLQEQSVVSSVPERRQTEMLPAARKLCQLIRKAGSRPVLFLTWARKQGDLANRQFYPEDTFQKMQARVIAGYREVARDTEARLVPVGAAWRAVYEERSDIELFAPDGLHASEAGVHLAAAVFLAALLERDPTEIEESKAPEIPGLSGEQLSYLYRVAKKTVESFQP